MVMQNKFNMDSEENRPQIPIQGRIPSSSID